MSDRRARLKSRVLNAMAIVAVTVCAAAAGSAAAPAAAAAQPSHEMSGWTCRDTDLCHAGTAECCDDPTTVEELTHCSTLCPG